MLEHWRRHWLGRASAPTHAACALILVLGAAFSLDVSSAAAQAPASSGFAPLERWKTAVLTGDKASLKEFYSTAPQAFAQTPKGKTVDPRDEEADFWAAQRAQGLTAIEPKILESTTPQPGMRSVVLRIEMTFQAQGETRKWMVSAAQVWVSQTAAGAAGAGVGAASGDWHILVTQRSDVVPLPTIRLPQPSVPNTHLYADPSEGPKELAEALMAAKQDHKRVLVVFGANWCYDCHVLDAALRSKELAPLVTANYHVIHINIGEGKENADMADRFQVPLNKGIPSLAVLDGNAQLITSQKNGEFESAAKIGMDDVSGFLKQWRAPVSK